MSPPVKQCTFAGGEITPAAFARSDLPLYEKSARTLRNIICMKHGGVTGRPGTMYVGTALNGGNPVRLIPFIFNETGLGQSYLLEFGNEYIAFYQNGGNVVLPQVAISAATNANPCVVTATGHGYSNGDIIVITGVLGMTQINSYFIVQNVTTNTFSLTDLQGNSTDSTGYGTFITCFEGASKIYKIATPYLQADLATLNFSESADIITIVHKNYAVRELSRIAPTNWTLAQITNWGSNVTAPGSVVFSGTPLVDLYSNYVITSVDSKGQESDAQSPGFDFVTPGAFYKQPSATDPVVITWAAASGAVSYRIYATTPGSSGGGTTFGFIGETLQTTFVDSGQDRDFTNLYPQYTQIFGNDGSGNCPSTVGFSQQRRYFGNTINNPIGFWGSQPGLYGNFDVHITSIDSDAIIGSIAGEEVNAIETITELKFMLMLTAGAELYIQGNGSGVVTPSAINASVQSSYGCAPIRPLKTGDVLIFNQALGSKVRDFAFDFAIDGYRGNDISIFASHLFEGYQIKDWCYQKEPDSIIYVARSDGMMLTCTYIREQQVLAWTHGDLKNGFVENLCSIPENGEYAVYASIRRIINGETVRYIERVSSRIWQGPVATVAAGMANVVGDPIEAPFSDCSSQYDGRNQGATTMTLSPNIFIATGVNDVIQFREPTGANVELAAIIPPGSYTASTILTAIAAAMNALSTNVYVVTLSSGKIAIGNGGATFLLEFQSGSPNFARSAALTLGFLAIDYTVAGGGPVVASVVPSLVFSTGPTAYQQQLTLTSSSAFFNNNGLDAQVGDQIVLNDALFISSQGTKGNQIRLTIQSIATSLVCTVTPNSLVPTVFQNVATTLWSRAVNTVSGLIYLEGQKVSVWADRFVVGSPLNRKISNVYTVSNGMIILDKPYSVIYVGLPMIQDVETLDLETYFGETILGRRKRMAGLTGYIYQTRSFYAGSESPDTNNQNTTGDPLFQLFSLRTGLNQGTYDQPPDLLTSQDYLITTARWNKRGSIFMRNVDPVPWTLLAVSPREEDAAQTPYKRV